MWDLFSFALICFGILRFDPYLSGTFYGQWDNHIHDITQNKATQDRTVSWWRHQMETFSAILAICAGNSPVIFPHKDPWRGAFMFNLICARINGWVNNREIGDLRRYRAHFDVTVMCRHYTIVCISKMWSHNFYTPCFYLYYFLMKYSTLIRDPF